MIVVGIETSTPHTSVAIGTELEILATNKLDDQFDGSMAVVGNEIFLRGKQNLYCIAAE